MCSCFERELNRRMLAELGLTQSQTFERFEEGIFSDAQPISQRALMRRNRDICEQYADQYPLNALRNLLFVGQSGLGKTFLMQAIAHRVTERGYAVMYVSAYKLLLAMRKAYFDNSNEGLDTYLDAPLLMIDDLGTEPLMENITVTQFFNLLNERQNAGAFTVVSSNLTMTELKKRYTERITSRLLDESRWKILRFAGDDVREKLGKAKRDGGATA
jgi:DNA replication protein DnaC